jgi:hypothetical protein
MARLVQRTPEFVRILSLPRRKIDEEDKAGFRFKLSEKLRTVHGRETLFPIQALAMYEMYRMQGLFGSIAVGFGKTLISLLAGTVLASKSPLLLLPASLISKTEREMRRLEQHWRISARYRMFSYQALGRTGAAHALDPSSDHAIFKPDLIVADECHYLKDRKAAVTKRVERYMEARPGTAFVALSGTITKDTIEDYAHIMRWCLGRQNTPLPNVYSELKDWASVLDPEDENSAGEFWKDPEQRRRENVEPGALWSFAPMSARSSSDNIRPIRRGFGTFLSETPGVIMTSKSYTGASLRIGKLDLAPVPEVTERMQRLRGEWMLPDEWPLFDAPLVRMAALEMVLGFFYKWEPRPPSEWNEKRKAWAGECRDILKNNRRNLDSELQVTNAVDAGLYPESKRILEEWRAIRDTFTPHPVAEWFSDHAIEACAAWAKGRKGSVIWTAHTAFGERLALKNCWPYFGEGGMSNEGLDIETTDEPIIVASIQANGTGRNLQRYNQALGTCWPSNAKSLEQWLGRHHREGQRAHEVRYDFLCGCLEHVRAWKRSRAHADGNQETTLQEQRINFADIEFDESALDDYRPGPEWNK